MNTKMDTIVSIATAMNQSGIAIIRMSGNLAFSIIDQIFQSKKNDKKLSSVKNYTVHYGYIVDQEVILDEVLVLVMRGPNSYTREDVIEIHCHGGIIVTKSILELLIREGARVAEPGEFTKRAFLNGRIDLSQAEAVMDLIQAKTKLSYKASMQQLNGNISKIINELREQIKTDICFIEASLDDPEEIHLNDFSRELKQKLKSYFEKIDLLLQQSERGEWIKEGINTVILGKPNVGKSSLLNFLIGKERAIVTDIPGTTRDILKETIQMDEICLNIVDTAGIHQTEDQVEKIGILKAKQMADEADLILYLIDASVPLGEEDKKILFSLKHKKCIVLLNKIDLNQSVKELDVKEFIDAIVLPISIKNGKNMDTIEKNIKDLFFQNEISWNDQIYIVNLRQKNALLDAKKSLKFLEESLENRMEEDLYTIDLIDAYKSLGKIIGEEVEEDFINAIFDKFCIGK